MSLSAAACAIICWSIGASATTESIERSNATEYRPDPWQTPSRGRPRWDFECLSIPPERFVEVPEETRSQATQLPRDRQSIPLDAKQVAFLLQGKTLDARALAEQAALELEQNARAIDDGPKEIDDYTYDAAGERERRRWAAALDRYEAAYNRLVSFQLKPYLIRAVALRPSSPDPWILSECGREVNVDHSSIWTNQTRLERLPLVVLLPNVPSKIYIHAQGLE